jgi:putative pyruvate formate lyase activating enzyme
MRPGYLERFHLGELDQRIGEALEILRSCELCPRLCSVDRSKDELGFCRTGRKAVVSSFNAHFGEEAPLVGRRGSGTIFFTNCNLRCIFCQNYEISHLGMGRTVEPEDLARMMIELQRMGCHNINFVTPSHVVAQILEALPPAIDEGLCVPLVYNSGGYDRLETLKLLDGIVDIYMPDVKFFDSGVADTLCKAPDYPRVVQDVLREMHRQVGDLEIDEQGIAQKGLLVRHLVMPQNLSQTSEVMDFLAREISTNTYVNVMDQYRPCGEAHTHPSLANRLSREDFRQALDSAHRAGLHRLDSRERPRIMRLF